MADLRAMCWAVYVAGRLGERLKRYARSQAESIQRLTAERNEARVNAAMLRHELAAANEQIAWWKKLVFGGLRVVDRG